MASAQGFHQAQHNLASYYRRGVFVSKDVRKAASLYRLAIKNGSPIASYELGRLMQSGELGHFDSLEIFKLFKSSADAGVADAQNELGVLYFTGRGAPIDRERAFGLFRQAAYQGQPTAQFNLAKSFVRGIGVDPDVIEAMKWLNILSDTEPSDRVMEAIESLRPFLSDDDLRRAKSMARICVQTNYKEC